MTLCPYMKSTHTKKPVLRKYVPLLSVCTEWTFIQICNYMAII